MSLWEVAYAIEDGFSLIMSYNVGYMFICDIIKPLYIYEGSLCSAAHFHIGHFFKALNSMPALVLVPCQESSHGFI